MTPRCTIDRLIINSPYEEPARHWRYERETRTFDLVMGRRPAGYVVASGESKAFDDPGVLVEIPLVNQIRPRVKAWREACYPGVSSITKPLLDHWRDPEEFEARRFFFCVEAHRMCVGADCLQVSFPDHRHIAGSHKPLFFRRCASEERGAGQGPAVPPR